VKLYDKDGGGGSSKDLVNSFLMHQIYLSRYSTYEARKLVTILDNANSLIKQRILKAKSIDTKKQYERIASEIRRIMNEAVETLDRQLDLDFTGLADEEIQFVEKTLSKVTVKTEFSLPAPKKVWAAASFGPYAGPKGDFTFKKYMDSLGDSAFNIWDIACRSAYLTGTPAKAIVKSVLGTINTDGWEAGHIQKLRNSLEMNARTMISSMAETARDAVYKENEEIFDYYIRLETLDSRTCLACGVEDLKRYPDLESAPKLPAHHGCRGLYLPHAKGMPEYLAGDERASVDGPVPANMSYKDWFEQLDPAQQEEILGKYRYEAYKNGVSIDAFAPDGRKLSLAELQQKENLPFYKTLSPKQREEFQEQSNAVYDSLTNSQRASLYEYTTGSHNQINGVLYGLEPMNPFVQDTINDIEQAMDKFALDYNMTVFSGTNREHYEGWKAGEIHSIDGYVSTAITRKPAENFYKREEKRGNTPLMLEIRTPKGARGIYIGNNTGFPHPQNEFLLGKGLRYRVIDNSENSIILEVIQ
jgi:hypothetical protein